MKTNYYIEGKKTTKKALTEKLGAERLKRMTEEAKQGFLEDPFEEQSYFLGSAGVLVIEFA